MDEVPRRGGVKLKKWFSVAWLLIVGIGVAVEMIGVRSKDKGDTLSEHVWFILAKVDSLGPFGKILRATLTVFIVGLLGWLIPHFTLGWW